MFTIWRRSRRGQCERIVTRRIADSGGVSVTDRQELICDFRQATLEAATGIVVGAGGIGSEIAEGLVRKGAGLLRIFDHDCVSVSNLNRQFFFECDLGKPKGARLVRNLAAHATCRTVLEGYALSFQDAVALGMDLDATFVVCGVDNGRTRVDVSRHFRAKGTPVIFVAVDSLAETGYVLVQETNGPCFGCFFPRTLYGRKQPCRAPASKDVLKVVAGLALYAVDSVLMERKKAWNYRQVHLAGFAPDTQLLLEGNPECPLCHE